MIRTLFVLLMLCCYCCFVVYRQCTPIKQTVYANQPTAFQIGDSITVRCGPELNAYGITTNGQVGRQFVQGVAIAEENYGNLPQTVIVALGTNGPIVKQNVWSMMDALHQVRHVFFVTVLVPRPWEREVNQMLRWARHEWKRVRLVHWHGVALHHPEWLDPDGIHPNVLGCAHYARLIDRTLKASRL